MGNKTKNFAFNILFASLSVLVVFFLHDKILLASALLFLIGIVGLLKWKSKTTIAIYFLAGIGGPILEMLMISNGIWTYSNYNVFNVPLWLFFLWANTGATLHQISLEMERFRNKK